MWGRGGGGGCTLSFDVSFLFAFCSQSLTKKKKKRARYLMCKIGNFYLGGNSRFVDEMCHSKTDRDPIISLDCGHRRPRLGGGVGGFKI